MRHGMMPWGRERLAELHYEQAVKEWNKPNPDRQKVLWHLNCATNLNPTFPEAIDLKAKVTGREVTSADNSSIRDVRAAADPADRAAADGARRRRRSRWPVRRRRRSRRAKPSSATRRRPSRRRPATQPAVAAGGNDGHGAGDDRSRSEDSRPTIGRSRRSRVAGNSRPRCEAPAVTITELPADDAT